ncbi:unnamed protein product [Moneuplotes crassus]|uniref:Rab-GAP TBC domain-containing protein n=1 Tax=Euplotes crassus TaxID=5936 RepID=A0AAD2D829_EUPCR|nr:unnamed protein product [Moneuplotes crassus]
MKHRINDSKTLFKVFSKFTEQTRSHFGNLDKEEFKTFRKIPESPMRRSLSAMREKPTDSSNVGICFINQNFYNFKKENNERKPRKLSLKVKKRGRSMNKPLKKRRYKIVNLTKEPKTQLDTLEDKNKSKRGLELLLPKKNEKISTDDRKKLWSYICKFDKKMKTGEFEKNLRKPCNQLKVIYGDLERTVVNGSDLVPKSKKFKDAVKLVKAMCRSKQGISYVQGMNHIAVALLEIFTPEESYCVFKSLVDDYKLHKMYTDNFPLLKLFSYLLETLIEKHLPKVSQWFKNNSLGLDILCPKWFLTIYSRDDNIELFLRTVDLLFITGTKALFQVALSILDLLERKGHLENFNFDASLSAQEIISNTKNFKVSNKLLKSLEKNSSALMKKTEKSKEMKNFKMLPLKSENFLEQNSGDESCHFDDITI